MAGSACSAMHTESTQQTEMQDANALRQLLTADQEELLDLIDKFREYRLNEIVDLPELVVCGKQSSGKSSVLEAISQLTFPRGEKACTTFATELILRRGHPSVKVSIRPASSGDPIEDFQPTPGAIEDFGTMINEAKRHLMNQHRGSFAASIFEETLQIEVCNPHWPPLTLVDLPGLIQSTNENQPKADIDKIHTLVHGYMQRPKTVILAVVEANDDTANQRVLEMAKELDPSRSRTMGIITKPDKIVHGSSMEREFVRCAQNKHEKYQFELGWHVVRNRDFNEEGASVEELEKVQFGPDSIWKKELDNEQLGINALRMKLSRILENHVRNSLPAVIGTIQRELKTCQSRLTSIGEPRSTAAEQQKYLIPISMEFQKRIREGVSGDSLFFMKPEPKKGQAEQRSLRSVVETKQRQFATLMYERGHRWAIKDSAEYSDWQPAPTDTIRDGPQLPKPGEISCREYIDKIQKFLDDHHGPYLDGTFDPRLVNKIFREQSERWQSIAEAHIEGVFSEATTFLKNAAKEVANEYTAKALQDILLFDFLKAKRHELKDKLMEVLKPYHKLHAATYVRSFGSDVIARRKERNPTAAVNGLAKELQTWKPTFESGSDLYRLADHAFGIVSRVSPAPAEFAATSTEILDLMYLYYRTALRMFIDNVTILVVESCLMFDLDRTFSPQTVSEMITSDHRLLAALASEPAHISHERTRLKEKEEKLVNALDTCWMKLGGVWTSSTSAIYEQQPDVVLSPPADEHGVEGSKPDMASSTSSSDRSLHSRSLSSVDTSTPATAASSYSPGFLSDGASKAKTRPSSSSGKFAAGGSNSSFGSAGEFNIRRSSSPSRPESRLRKEFGRAASRSIGSEALPFTNAESTLNGGSSTKEQSRQAEAPEEL